MSTLVLAGVILTGAWTQFDEIGWAGWLPVVVALAFDRYTPAALRWRKPTVPALVAERPPVIACAFLCAMLLAHVALTWREEFGFSGDEGYHLSATRAFALYFLRAGPLLAAVLAVYGILRFKGFRYAATLAMAGLLAASYLLPSSALFGRYPTAFYLLALPLNVALEAVHSPYPFSANHLVNALSLPVWLFALRPLVIGRWPDWHVLPVALLVYFQPPSLVYAASTLLEPWAVVFLLLSMEALVTYEPADRWMAVPLCAVATFFKETAILLVPAVWLLSCLEWRGWRPSIRREGLLVGVAAATPFLVYYAVRRGLRIERGYELASAGSIWTMARVGDWLANVREQLGIGGMLTVGAAMALTVRHGTLWIVTAVAAALFFFVDTASLPYTGYGRFLAYSLLAVCGAVFASVYHAVSQRRVLIVMSVAIAALQLPATARMFALDLEPDHERNSVEWNGALIRLPIRTLAAHLPGLQGGEQVRRIRVVTFATELTSLRVAYPDIAERYELVGDQQSPTAPDCRCRDNSEAVLAAFEWPAHFGNTPANRAFFDLVSSACVKQMETACASRAIETDRSGAAIGVMGVGRLLLLATPQDHEPPKR